MEGLYALVCVMSGGVGQVMDGDPSLAGDVVRPVRHFGDNMLQVRGQDGPPG